MDDVGFSFSIERSLTLQDREELGHIAFFLAQLDALRARGILTDEQFRTIGAEYRARREGIEQKRRYEALLDAARQLRDHHQPAEALALAMRATELSPEQRDAWTLAIDLKAALGRYDDAIQIASGVVDKFPALRERIAELRREQEQHEQGHEQAAAAAQDTQRFAGLLKQMREAIHTERDRDALELGRQLLELQPGERGVMGLMALAHSRIGQVEEALAVYRELHAKEPESPAWTARIAELERGRGATPEESTDVVLILDEEAKSLPPEAVVLPPVPSLTWGSIAGQFLQEHWQKLILCLAVLLIVVSSTVGAHHLLGEQLLWSRAGQCLLAVVYTALFGIFGAGLVRWGAERAGRIMLLTTLSVVPINFSLAGELRLLSLPTTSHLAIFAAVAIVLFFLCWLVVTALQMKEDGLFPIAFFLLSAFDATAARGVPFLWGFAALVASSVVFLGAVWGLCSRLEQGEPTETRRDFAYFALGLLTYAFLFFAYRSGVFVLRLIPRVPPLLAVPTMFAGIAAVRTARALPRFDKDPRRILSLQLAGLALAGLAFALALAHKPIGSALLSGNTLATAVLGFALFAGLLWSDRQPAYMYLSFGAMVVAYFGAYYFLRDLMEQVMVWAGHVLGYRHRLPEPFKAINAVVFNLVLVGLWVVFRRGHDERLARHCHFIGLPLSVAACLVSALEPKAALICLSAYVVLYALGTWFFAQPRLLYLACAAAAGAAAFGAWLALGFVAGRWALGMAGIGFVFWLVTRALIVSRVEAKYRRPLLHSALGAAAIGLGIAIVAVLPPLVVPLEAHLALFVIALVCALVALEISWPLVAYFAVGLASAGYLVAVAYVNGGALSDLSAAQVGISAALGAVALCLLGEPARRLGAHRMARTGRASALSLYVWPLYHIGLVLVCLACWAGLGKLSTQLPVADVRGLVALAVMWGLCALALAAVAAFAYRHVAAASAVTILASAAYVAGTLAALMETGVSSRAAAMAVALGALALAQALGGVGINRLGRNAPTLALYREPVVSLSLLAVVAGWFLALSSWTTDWLIASALALDCAALVVVAGLAPRGWIAHGAIASALGAWFCAFEIATNRELASSAVYGLLAALFALSLLVVCETIVKRTSSRSQVFSKALPVFAVGAVAAAIGLLVLGWANNLTVVATLLLAALVFLWATRFRHATQLVYAGLFSAAGAALCLNGWLQDWNRLAIALGWTAVTLALGALALWTAGFLARRFRVGDFYVVPCHVVALLLGLDVFEVALAARAEALAAFPLAVSALLLNALLLLLLTTQWRRAALTYGSIAALVLANYLTLISVGPRDPEMVWILGLAAVVQAILLWAGGMFCRGIWGRARVEEIYARPLFIASLLLTLLAVPLAYDKPVAMLLVGLSFVLMVKSLESEYWLYFSVSALSVSAYFAFLDGRPQWVLVWGAVVGAYIVWAFGVSLQAARPALCRRLYLNEREYETPLFHAAALFAVLAAALRVDMTLRLGSSWAVQPALPAALGLLSLLMLKVDASRAWVHLAAGLFTVSIAALADRWIEARELWLLVAILVAGAWLALRAALERVERPLCRWAGVRQDRYSEVITAWSLGTFAVGAALIVVLVTLTVGATLLGQPIEPARPASAWPGILTAIVLAGCYLDSAARIAGFERLVIGLLAVGPLLAWWLGVRSSPIVRALRIDPAAFEPVATALVALATGFVGRGAAPANEPQRFSTLLWVSDGRRTLFAAYAWQAGVLVSLAAVGLTLGHIGFATVATLLIVVATLAQLAADRRRVDLAAMASAAWAAVFPYAVLASFDSFGLSTHAARTNVAALAAVVASFALLAAAGRVVARASRGDAGTRAADSVLCDVARALEKVAVLATGLAATFVVGDAVGPRPARGDLVVLSGVLVLIGLSSVLAVVARRWLTEWPVYAAQAALVGAYFYYRAGYAASFATDALVLVLLGYLDFAIAEAMRRLRLNLYARPTLYFSLVMPLLPIGLAIWHGEYDDVSLFVLFATATFYAVACYQLQWRRLGYAATVLYNAFLWMMWAWVGWKLVDHPQFFLIPVGFSAILFAEVNRHELGRDYVNALRYIGLVTIYASLAVPIWQHQSFGAWLTLLLLSLLGIFVGIGLQVQSFLWLGLACFCLDSVYQLGRMGMEHTLAKWGIMLALGILLFLFVALNEKKGIVAAMRDYYEQVRHWD
jgi:tetratricopeptide (TPR) repeat protein